ncbi:hypothetical protein [Kutzneria sp. CA-103260]|uniref:hypothetical protein n=1 Tax=Kutzneria sp. CA-103260 TaxID=2802641 RepID=UPI001BA90E29|nr:hypothetical protein [Kutzneria sp. CA-103260]
MAATFLIVPIVAYRHGTAAQHAAEAQVESQGYEAELLSRHRIRFAESGAEMLLPFAIAVLMGTLAALNAFDTGIGRILSLVVQPLLLLAGGVVTAGQVFVVRFTESALRKSGDAAVRDLDVKAFIDAAEAAFPSWLRYLIVTRFVLVTMGSAFVVLVLATA